jgi:Concanavalin A-like lectin/glucanases superfamily/Secretion system C-terminal sorting domain
MNGEIMKIKIVTILIVVSASLASAQFNKAAHFLGSNGYIMVPTDSSLRMTEEITIETWVKIDSLHSSQIGLTGSWDDIHGAQRTWFLWILSGRFEFLVSVNGASFARASGFFPDDSTWYHLAGTFNGNTVSLYVNDSLITSVSYTATIHTNTLPFYIGRTESGSNGSDYMYGWLDELRIWNKARNLEQIVKTYGDTLDGRYYNTTDSGLVAYYRFDSAQNLGAGVDSTLDVFDHSIYANHGDIIGHVDFDSSGIVVTNLAKNKDAYAAEKFSLFQNYPNPFNPITLINYELRITNFVRLTVYDALGREVETLVNKYQNAGNYQVTFDGSSQASGIYYYKITAGNFIQTRKMLLLK